MAQSCRSAFHTGEKKIWTLESFNAASCHLQCLFKRSIQSSPIFKAWYSHPVVPVWLQSKRDNDQQGDQVFWIHNKVLLPDKKRVWILLLKRRIIEFPYLTRSATFLVTRLPVCFFSMLCNERIIFYHSNILGTIIIWYSNLKARFEGIVCSRLALQVSLNLTHLGGQQVVIYDRNGAVLF